MAFATSAVAEVSFEGETIEWIIPFGTGGGSDTWARFNAPFLSEHLPGNPDVVVVNEPGGGSTRGTAEGLVDPPAGNPAKIRIEHPSGEIEVSVDYAREDNVVTINAAGLARTARLLARAEVMVPEAAFTVTGGLGDRADRRARLPGSDCLHGLFVEEPEG